MRFVCFHHFCSLYRGHSFLGRLAQRRYEAGFDMKLYWQQDGDLELCVKCCQADHARSICSAILSYCSMDTEAKKKC